MARKTFTLNTQPHVAEIGETELLFQPEVMGDEFLDAYSGLQDTTKTLGVDLSDLANVDVDQLRAVTTALRTFLARLMLPESAERFACWTVQVGGKVVGTYSSSQDAAEAAASRKNAKVADRSMRLPDRVLVELLEWAVELYGGGSRPTSSSSGSVPQSRMPGTSGRAASPSRGSTSTRGR
ncbi:hypothetical protein OG216_19275 [Streptomycetaceae bacterium NBC_01309]